MGEVLSQNEIDSLLQALSSGELDAEDMKVKDEKQVKNMILPVQQSSQKSICVRWKSFLNIMEDFFRRTYLFI